MTVTAKSDIATLLVQLLMVYFVIKAIQEKKSSALILSIGAAIFSFCFKPSSIVFTSVLLIPAIIIFIIKKIKIAFKDLFMLLLPIAANAFLMARTWLLTGMPMTQFGVGVFKTIGFSYNFPYAEASGEYMVSVSDFFFKGIIWDRLPRLWDFLFSPINETMDHVVIAWGGVLFALCWLILVVYVFSNPKRTLKKIKNDSAYAYSLIAVALISALSMGTMLLLNKPDGNYFMLMYALTFIHLVIEVRDLPSDFAQSCCKKAIPLVVSSAVILSLTSWAWSLGFTQVDSAYNKNSYYDHSQSNADYFEGVGIKEIVDKLSEQGGKKRVMIISKDEPILLSIPAIADNWKDLSYWGNSQLAQSSNGLYDYFKVTGMDYLLIEKETIEADGARNAANFILELVQGGYLAIDSDEGNYMLISFDENGGYSDNKLKEYFLSVCE